MATFVAKYSKFNNKITLYMTAMVSVNCQLGRIKDHLGDESLSMPIRDCVEYIN